MTWHDVMTWWHETITCHDVMSWCHDIMSTCHDYLTWWHDMMTWHDDKVMTMWYDIMKTSRHDDMMTWWRHDIMSWCHVMISWHHVMSWHVYMMPDMSWHVGHYVTCHIMTQHHGWHDGMKSSWHHDLMASQHHGMKSWWHDVILTSCHDVVMWYIGQEWKHTVKKTMLLEENHCKERLEDYICYPTVQQMSSLAWLCNRCRLVFQSFFTMIFM